jgi:hypothetical protein
LAFFPPRLLGPRGGGDHWHAQPPRLAEVERGDGDSEEAPGRDA